MACDITIPSLGVAMENALVVAWLKQEGDQVEADEPVVEIETDKSTMELVAPAAGRLGPHLYAEGAIVPVGVAVAAVYDADDGVAAVDVPAGDPVGDPVASAPAGRAEPQAPRQDAGSARTPHRASPRARRLAATSSAASELPAPTAPTRSGRFRELIAGRVSESWQTTPHFSVVREIEVEQLRAELDRLKAAGRSLTVTDLLLRAQALALAAEPDANEASDLGLAVASEHGVMIPVVRNVLGRSLDDLAAARQAAVNRGREGRLAPDDLELPSSTLSNLGTVAIDAFTGIIAVGQSSLVTVGRIRRAPCVVGDEIVARDVLTATVNADHRVLDGADAARILVAFAAQLENPTRLVKEGPLVD
jgi:pyruvate dehydrogenase E2 component (dihydrolipoamide acetyltransferase)